MIVPGKKMSCMTVETGTLIFAIINISDGGGDEEANQNWQGEIATAASSLCAIAIFTISMVSMYGITAYDEHSIPINAQIAIFAWFLSLFAMFASFIGLVFAVFLIHGIVNKNPAHIKAYFVYGVVVTVLCSLPVVGFAGHVIDSAVPRDIGVFIGAFLALFIYSLILHMIQRTYKKLEVINAQYDHKMLEVQKC